MVLEGQLALDEIATKILKEPGFSVDSCELLPNPMHVSGHLMSIRHCGVVVSLNFDNNNRDIIAVSWACLDNKKIRVALERALSLLSSGAKQERPWSRWMCAQKRQTHASEEALVVWSMVINVSVSGKRW
jgi:hypothetical protein